MSGDGFTKHDCVLATTKAIMTIFVDLLRDEEFREALLEVHEAVEAGFDAFHAKRAHLYDRLQPMSN
jgi:hypothetical protein